jgi:hypothetical protein
MFVELGYDIFKLVLTNSMLGYQTVQNPLSLARASASKNVN